MYVLRSASRSPPGSVTKMESPPSRAGRTPRRAPATGLHVTDWQRGRRGSVREDRRDGSHAGAKAGKRFHAAVSGSGGKCGHDAGVGRGSRRVMRVEATASGGPRVAEGGRVEADRADRPLARAPAGRDNQGAAGRRALDSAPDHIGRRTELSARRRSRRRSGTVQVQGDLVGVEHGIDDLQATVYQTGHSLRSGPDGTRASGDVDGKHPREQPGPPMWRGAAACEGRRARAAARAPAARAPSACPRGRTETVAWVSARRGRAWGRCVASNDADWQSNRRIGSCGRVEEGRERRAWRGTGGASCRRSAPCEAGRA